MPWVTPSLRRIPVTDEIVRKILAANGPLVVPRKRIANG